MKYEHFGTEITTDNLNSKTNVQVKKKSNKYGVAVKWEPYERPTTAAANTRANAADALIQCTLSTHTLLSHTKTKSQMEKKLHLRGYQST